MSQVQDTAYSSMLCNNSGFSFSFSCCSLLESCVDEEGVGLVIGVDPKACSQSRGLV